MTHTDKKIHYNLNVRANVFAKNKLTVLAFTQNHE